MNNRKTQVDYIILINRRWKNSLNNNETYNSFGSIGSDHRLVTAKLKMTFRKSKTPKKNKLYDWSHLKNNPELQELHTVTVKNHFNELQVDDESVSAPYSSKQRSCN